MPRKNYDRDISFKFWLVSESDLKKVHEFFVKRFGSNNIDISVRLKSGDELVYDDFKDFSSGVKGLIDSHEELVSLSMSGSKDSTHYNSRRHVWLTVIFSEGMSQRASIHIRCSDKDGSLKDWVEGVQVDAKSLVKSLSYDDKFIACIKEKFGIDGKFFSRENVIHLDFYGEEKNEITCSLNKKIQSGLSMKLKPGERFSKWLREHWLGILIISVGVPILIEIFT